MIHNKCWTGTSPESEAKTTELPYKREGTHLVAGLIGWQREEFYSDSFNIKTTGEVSHIKKQSYPKLAAENNNVLCVVHLSMAIRSIYVVCWQQKHSGMGWFACNTANLRKRRLICISMVFTTD